VRVRALRRVAVGGVASDDDGGKKISIYVFLLCLSFFLSTRNKILSYIQTTYPMSYPNIICHPNNVVFIYHIEI